MGVYLEDRAGCGDEIGTAIMSSNLLEIARM